MTPPAKDEATDDKPTGETRPQKEPEKEKEAAPSPEAKTPAAAVKESPGVSTQIKPETDVEINERVKLKELVTHYAVNHPEKLRELLEIAPESVKPAILESITASEDSYQKVLEELDNRSGGAVPEESGIEKQDEAPKDEGSRPGQSGDTPVKDNSGTDRSNNSSKKK